MRSRVTAGLAATLLALVASGCGQTPDPGATGSPASPSTARRVRTAQAGGPSSVDLAGLQREVPEYGGSNRNLFAFGSRPAVAPPPPPDTPAPPRTTPPPVRTTPPAATAPQIDLKFAGLVETKTVAGDIKKYAVLLDGTEILTGAEGDLVGNRYRIVQIGLESVTLGVAGSNDTQLIPLQSN